MACRVYRLLFSEAAPSCLARAGLHKPRPSSSHEGTWVHEAYEIYGTVRV